MVLMFLSLFGCDAPVWQEDRCGRRDPVGRACSDTDGATIEVGTDPTCADQGLTAGAACDEEGATCVALRPQACENTPETVINSDQIMTCSKAPMDDLCPESSRRLKQDIAYLDAGTRKKLAAQALDLKLATYTYLDPTKNGGGQQLGYILDDAPGAAFSGDERVNLYAYTSAVLAAVQEQQVEIAELRAKIAELEARDAKRAAGTAR